MKSMPTTAIADLFGKNGPLNDLVTHRAAWREALVTAKRHAAERHAVSHVDYYRHEIAVFDRTFAEIDRLATPVIVGKPDLSQFDNLECRVCAADTPPKSVSVRDGKTVVSYQCSHCMSSWRINDNGDETHFRDGRSRKSSSR